MPSIPLIKIVRVSFLSIGLLFLNQSARSQTVGTTTADILKINEGARPAAMGGAYTAMGDDIYSISYNPAGLSYLKASQLVIMHLDSLADIEYEYLSFGTAWGSGNVLALNATYRHEPPIDNNNGNPAVNSDDLLASLSYAMKFGSNFRGGLTAKYLKSDLAFYSATAFAVDLGVVLDHLPLGIRAGAAIQNLGTGMTFTPGGSGSSSGSPSESLPLFLRFGLGTHQVIDGNKDLNIGVELFKPSDQDIKLGLGGEYWVFPELFVVRAGYKIENLGAPYGGTNTNVNPNQPYPGVSNAFQNYTLGCTLTRNIDGDDFSIDIAYDPADFSTTTQDSFFFALNLRFNQLRIF
jgi:hypothetical protein